VTDFLIKVVGYNAVRNSLQRRMRALNDRRSTNAQAVVIVDRWIQKNFQQEGALAHGGGWAPLAPGTIVARQKRRAGRARILQDTGGLKSRWKRFWDRRRAMVQSAYSFARYHQDGGKHLPQRRIVPTNEQIWPELQKLFGRWMRRVLR
jgi:phage gpG-like protein